MDGLVSFFQANAAQYIIPRTQLRSSLQRWPSPALVRPLTNDASCPFAALVPPARRSARFLHGLSSTASETQKTRGGDKKDDNKDQDSLDGLDLHPTAFGSREDVSQQYSPCKQDGTQESSAKEDCDVVFGKGLEGKGTGEAQQPWYMSERMQTIWEWSLFIHLPEVILFLSLSSGIIPVPICNPIVWTPRLAHNLP